jgi:hypothetical protein
MATEAGRAVSIHRSKLTSIQPGSHSQTSFVSDYIGPPPRCYQNPYHLISDKTRRGGVARTIAPLYGPVAEKEVALHGR